MSKQGIGRRIGSGLVMALVVVGSLAGGLWLASRFADEGGDGADQVVGPPSGMDPGDPGLVHVHGMGFNPADGTLYAATHTGLFRVDSEGRAERVGDRFQDTMGFTVVGPDHFLASGHPALDDEELRVEGRPPLLGLIESRDAGRSWQPLSLLGEADFHSIAVAGEQILAYDSTGAALLASEDGGRTWQTRSSIELFEMAVDPAAPERVAGITPEGTVLESADGGRSWMPVEAAPEGAVVVAWGRGGLLVGTESGGLHQRGADGRWSELRRFGAGLEALTASGDQVLAAVAGEGIFHFDGTDWRKAASAG